MEQQKKDTKTDKKKKSPSGKYATEKQPVYGKCGSEKVEHIGHMEQINE
ncbi:unnamed protein product [marine sediment metagenome]|uniref:Uncharacterized protein n=1 Tax=marine sediment metagenome TaxID=412755 RepID=X1UE94_9ZZZZ